MTPYPSIETIYVRDAATKRLRFGEIRMPEVDCVSEWTISEKIDGTNIRAIVTTAGIEVRGRTDKANLQTGLEEAVRKALPSLGTILAYFVTYRGRKLPLPDGWSVTFYGEGYGAGIQKGGAYSPEKRFRCFDLRFGNGSWADDSEMRNVCADLGIPVAPSLGRAKRYGIPESRQEILNWFAHGESRVAGEDSDTRDVEPEGIVAKPLTVLLDKHGNRVMWKLTLREFKD